ASGSPRSLRSFPTRRSSDLIGQRRLVGGARHPDRLGGDADAAAFEVRQRDAVTLALGTEQEIGGQFHVLEDELRGIGGALAELRSEEHTSELQSRSELVCRL